MKNLYYIGNSNTYKADKNKQSFIIRIIVLIVLFLVSFASLSSFIFVRADTGNGNTEIYLVYNEDGRVIFESNLVEVGDKIIDANLNEYEIYSVDHSTQTAYAELNGYYEKPNINKRSSNLYFSNHLVKKSVGLYMSHNDESYVPSDNTSSVYGKGGIHDVAKSLSNEFKALNYDVYLDETLHLPHDSNAYARSLSTAKGLLAKNVDALFDIHRDGVARSVYVKTIDGKERCKVRIVVGQANPNKDANLQFAMYLVSVAKEYCPWLFLDIYYAKGHYNQALTSKGLLFEMGTYLAEKELVLDSTKYLASVIDKTLFSTVVDDNNTLTIVDTPTTSQEGNLVNKVLNDATLTQPFTSKYLTNVIIFSIIFVSGTVAVSVMAVIKHRKRLKLAKTSNTSLIETSLNNKKLNSSTKNTKNENNFNKMNNIDSNKTNITKTNNKNYSSNNSSNKIKNTKNKTNKKTKK